MALTHNQLNVGTAADAGDGDTIRAGGIKLDGNIANLISAVNNILTLIGAGNETVTDLAAFNEAIIPDGRTVKQALQDIETFVTNLNVLDPGYVAGSAVAPAAGDTLEQAVAKLHALLNALDQAVVLKGTWDASTGSFPGGGTAQAGFSYIVSVAGTVDAVSFAVGDRIIAITDNASTSTFASNWFKADYTDQVSSFNSRTGAIVPAAGDYSATQITNTPSGDISAVNLQAAIDELDGEKVAKALLSAKGSIITASAANTPMELGVGTDGEAIIADSTTTSGLRSSAQVARTYAAGNLLVNTPLAAGVSVDVATHIDFAQTTANIQATIPNPTVATKHRSLKLENTGSADLTVLFTSGTGFVLTPGNVMDVTWNGTQWVAANAQLAVTASFARGVKAATQTINAINTNILFDTVQSSFGDDISLSAGVFTLKAGKTYRLRSSPGFFTTSGTLVRPSYSWFNITDNAVIGNLAGQYDQDDAATQGTFNAECNAIVRPIADTQVALRVVGGVSVINTVTIGQNSDFSGGSLLPWFDIEVIGGNAPIVGTSVDYSYGSATFNSAVVSPITIGQVTGNMTVAGNLITLKAGKTYHIECAMSFGSSAFTGTTAIDFEWRDGAGAAIPNVAPGRAIMAGNNANNQTSIHSTTLVITPAADMQVGVRVTSIAGISGAAVAQTGSYYRVTQIGSSAFTGLNDQTVSAKYLELGNMLIQWGETGNITTNATITFAKPFFDGSYAVTVSALGGANVEHRIESRGTTNFSLSTFNSSGSGSSPGPYLWMAIGRKA